MCCKLTPLPPPSQVGARGEILGGRSPSVHTLKALQGARALAALWRARSADTLRGLANNLAVPAHLKVKGTCPNETVHSRLRNLAMVAPHATYETKILSWRAAVVDHNGAQHARLRHAVCCVGSTAATFLHKRAHSTGFESVPSRTAHRNCEFLADAYLAAQNNRSKKYEIARDIVAGAPSQGQSSRHLERMAFLQYRGKAPATAEHWKMLGFETSEPKRLLMTFPEEDLDVVRDAWQDLAVGQVDVDGTDWAYWIAHYRFKDRLSMHDVRKILARLHSELHTLD